MAHVEILESRTLFNAAGWADTIDNPYMTLKPGLKWLYTGVSNGERVRNLIVVQSRTKVVKGVTCAIVLDSVYTEGELTEKTNDFFAQDASGNVWYFGEEVREIEGGKIVSREGSFLHGVNGAKAGKVMLANPKVGDSYTQENSPGVAEDQAQVLTLHAHAQTPFGRFVNCLETRESSPLEPTVTEAKYYKAGIGLVKSQSLTGEVEVLLLRKFVSF